jgi:hypothetical protein
MPAVRITAFQKNAFQNNAFQIATKKKVGWGFRHTREELEEKLQQQKAETFGLRWYDDYLAARAAVVERVESTTSRHLREALVEAIDAADEIVTIWNVTGVTETLSAAAKATRLTASLKHARAIVDYEAFTYLNDEYLRAWRNTRVKDTEAREKLWQAIHIVQLVHDHLNKWAIDGRIASKDLASIKYLKR